MSRRGRLLAAVLLVIALVTGGTTAPAGAGSAPEAAEVAAPRVPVLTKIRAAHHPGFDRIVFEFRGPVPDLLKVRWAKKVTFDGSGLRMPLQGGAFVEVVFNARTHVERDGELVRTYKRPVRSFGLPNLNHMIAPGAFEAVVGVGLGTMQRTRLLRATTLEDPSRVVVDIGTRFPRTRAKVFFVDEDRVADGTEPLVRPVRRAVPIPRVAAGSLHRLYAGPTGAERRDGLRLVTSIVPPTFGDRPDRTGFRDLRIRNGIARVTITGRCSSGGSTITIADEIMPTLMFWPSVDYVKIFDRRGNTAEPTGPSDSIPGCLEP